MSQQIRVVEKDGKKLAVLAFTDLDGTVNNQDLPEKDRLATITPAKEAIQELQKHNILVGIVTARSFGETVLYKKALGANGFTITEDGAVIILPQKPQETKLAFPIVSHDQQTALLLSEIDLSDIKNFLKSITITLQQKGLTPALTSTCTSTPEILKEMIHYQTVEDAKRAMDRLASAFVREATKEQYNLLMEQAPTWNIRISGPAHHTHIFGKNVDKGKAIKCINDNIQLFLPEIKDLDGILPIVFGNDVNDIKLFEGAHALGGMGIMVKNANGTYRVPEEAIPSFVIKTEDAYGYGMQEAISKILQRIKYI